MQGAIKSTHKSIEYILGLQKRQEIDSGRKHITGFKNTVSRAAYAYPCYSSKLKDQNE